MSGLLYHANPVTPHFKDFGLLACQSHYWVYRNQVRWARRHSMFEIKAGRALDRIAKALRTGRKWQSVWRKFPRQFRRKTRS